VNSLNDLEETIYEYDQNIKYYNHMISFLPQTEGDERLILLGRIAHLGDFLKEQNIRIVKGIEDLRLELAKRRLDKKMYGR